MSIASRHICFRELGSHTRCTIDEIDAPIARVISHTHAVIRGVQALEDQDTASGDEGDKLRRVSFVHDQLS